jgi:hypothetical protein
LLAAYRGLRKNPITTWGERAYQEPILAVHGLMGPVVIVNRPDAIRRVFLDNAQNYPKDAPDGWRTWRTPAIARPYHPAPVA